MRYLYTAVAILLMASCVLPSKHKKVVEDKERLLRENSSLLYLKEKNAKNVLEIKEMGEKLEKTESLLYEVNSKYNTSKEMHKKCQQDYNEMLLKNKKLLEKAFEDKSNLSSELVAKQNEIADKESRLQKIAKDLENQRLNQQLLKDNLDKKQKNIDSLKVLINDKEKKLIDLKVKIKSLLVGYSNDEITIEQREDGRLHISMSQNLLFEKGSDMLDAKGKRAIKHVAEVLKTEPEIMIMVEGHTDSDGESKRNWMLSTRRALAVVDVLQQNDVIPERIIAAGRGQYKPIVPNDNLENKAKNRRTEIILEPNLNDIMDFLK